MWNILANDGMAAEGQKQLESQGHKVDTDHKDLDTLKQCINDYDVIIVRSATKVRQELIDVMSRTKLIIRAGVGLDNIDVEYAQAKGIEVENTPKASSRSVAELAFAHLMGLYRFLPQAAREMAVEGDTNFKGLKKKYSKGQEIQGQRLGIIGLGRIGKELANIALGAGMDVIAHDPWTEDNGIKIKMAGQTMQIHIPLVSKEEVIEKSDVISIHIPSADEPIIGQAEIEACKSGVFLLNTARGGAIEEEALLKGLASGQVGGAALDVFENEPTPKAELLNHPLISVSPHIGASTKQAQIKIGSNIVEIIDKAYKAAQ